MYLKSDSLLFCIAQENIIYLTLKKKNSKIAWKLFEYFIVNFNYPFNVCIFLNFKANSKLVRERERELISINNNYNMSLFKCSSEWDY
jgi:hypothetical protein